MDILPGPGWGRLPGLLRAGQGTVMLLGATDSGNTTLGRYLVDVLSPGLTGSARRLA